MQRVRKLEILVGFFVLMAFAVLLGMTFVIRGNTGVRPYVVQAQFRNVAGLEIGAPVLVSGFRLGRVVEMEPTRTEDNEPAVVVTAKISREIPLYQDAIVTLAQQGFLGDKRLEIDPGQPSAGEVKKYEMLQSTAPTDMTAVFSEATVIAQELKATVEGIRKLITDEDRIAQIDETIANINSATERIAAMLEENRASLNQAVENMAEISEKSIAVAEKADMLVSNTQQQVDEIGEVARESLQNIRDSSQNLTRQIEQILNKADTTAANANELVVTSREEIRDISARLKETAANLDTLITSINEGEGTVGKLINDPRPFNDLQESITALKNVLLREQNELYDRRVPYRSGASEGSGNNPAVMPNAAEGHGSDSPAN